MAVASANIENQPEQNLSATDLPAGMPVPINKNQDVDTIEDDDSNIIIHRFRSLSRPRQLQLLISTAAIISVMFIIFTWSSDPNYKLLYGKLTVEAAGEIVEVLKQEGVDYSLDKDTGEILVPSDVLHKTRLKLASQGLPKNDGTGFEMLEKSNGFGTSQFMEQARYHHAIEGELARSIAELDSIDSSRVHLAIPKQSVFVRDRKEPSASVLINLKPGRALDESQVMAIVHIVASSIPDLSPRKVTVVDRNGKLLSKKELTGNMALSTAQFDYTKKLEEYYIERIERILIPIVGFEGVRAQVGTEVDFTSVEKTQESFNPDLPALRSEHTVNEESTSGGPGGVPGALTNQPPGPASAPEKNPGRNGNGSSGPSRKHKQETFNYELDKTVSHTKQAPGTLKRLTVAVVLDDRIFYEPDGTLVRTPLAPEEIDRIEALVKDAVGFDVSRGDRINIINTAFHDSQVAPPPPVGSIWEQPWFIDIAKQVVGVLLILLFIVLALRPVIRELTHKEEIVEEEIVEEEAAEIEAKNEESGGLSETQWEELGISYEEYENMLATLQELAGNDPRIVAQVIKTWVMLDEEGL
ncbi:MAG: flagellar basal-body MS-ring/collar protein FliF [Gammaproteobacteria bacterium]|nr:flagellar basal-body MS-ring/collar protein FliF [Gammaproteobacteria bacterium]